MQCDENGQPYGTMKHAEYKLMERYMHRYWGNFVRNGDPNDQTGAWYPEIIQVIIRNSRLRNFKFKYLRNCTTATQIFQNGRALAKEIITCILASITSLQMTSD